jgi:hypothetical protein
MEGTIISVLGCSLGLWHHIYEGNHYNSVSNAQTILKHKTRVCGTIRPNKGLHTSLKAKVKNLKKVDMIFKNRGDILVLIWNDMRSQDDFYHSRK